MATAAAIAASAVSRSAARTHRSTGPAASDDVGTPRTDAIGVPAEPLVQLLGHDSGCRSLAGQPTFESVHAQLRLGPRGEVGASSTLLGGVDVHASVALFDERRWHLAVAVVRPSEQWLADGEVVRRR